MAKIYPDVEVIKRFNPSPTEGELCLLHFLKNELDDSYQIFFNPYLNGDRPDIIVLRYGYGLLIFEVKDWNLSNFKLDDKQRWIYKPNEVIVKSPLSQVYKYKENLIELHVEELFQYVLCDIRYHLPFSCIVYFHKAREQEVRSLCIDSFDYDRNGNRKNNNKKYCDWIKHNIDLWGKDSLTRDKLEMLLDKRYITRDSKFKLPTNIYDNIRRILEPSEHLKTQGQAINYSHQQRKIIYSDSKEQRISGVFGSGKTTVLVARAVQAYKRACQIQEPTSVRVLILTFNIALVNYIKDRLKDVAEDFDASAFIIVNYHTFIKNEINNWNISIAPSEALNCNEISIWFETELFSNISLFKEHQKMIKPYNAILIDEVQDFKYPWLEILKGSFLQQGGEYVLFGDVKQNIYAQEVENKDVKTNVKGRPILLNHSFRSDAKVSDLAYAYQKVAFSKKYELDLKDEDGFAFVGSQGLVQYKRLDATCSPNDFCSLVRKVIGKMCVSPNDIVVLGGDNNWLCLFDAYYRCRSGEKTITTMETIEYRYLENIRKLLSREPMDNWLENLLNQVTKKKYNQEWREWKNSSEGNWLQPKLMLEIATLLSRMELEELEAEYMDFVLGRLCHNLCINYKTFRDGYWKCYETEISEFRRDVRSGDYERIRRHKKLHFWANRGTIKISSIHSFKGWESHTIIMVVSNDVPVETIDELLYVGITRAKTNLYIYNFGNTLFEERLKQCRDFQGNLIIRDF